MEDIKLNINTSIVAYELECIKCHKLKLYGNGDLKDTLVAEFENVVLKEHSCFNCGCNTFNIDVFIKAEIESKRVIS